jgi:hypothetical protein
MNRWRAGVLRQQGARSARHAPGSSRCQRRGGATGQEAAASSPPPRMALSIYRLRGERAERRGSYKFHQDLSARSVRGSSNQSLKRTAGRAVVLRGFRSSPDSSGRRSPLLSRPAAA